MYVHNNTNIVYVNKEMKYRNKQYYKYNEIYDWYKHRYKDTFKWS